MYTTSKNRTEDNPEIHAWPPKSTAQRTKDWTESGNIQKLDHENLPGRQRDVIHSVVMNQCRSRLVCWLKNIIDDFTINKVAANKCK